MNKNLNNSKSKNQTTQLKNGQRTRKKLSFFFQRRHTDGKHKDVFKITNHQGNTNQNHIEISLHSYQMAIILKIRKKC